MSIEVNKTKTLTIIKTTKFSPESLQELRKQLNVGVRTRQVAYRIKDKVVEQIKPKRKYTKKED